ncbi:MAG: hypothetical protein FJ197_10185 [Gammaproteobacteria bacterium]|nr:hypothetical protein [Gammaproteobacteria bacterium]
MTADVSKAFAFVRQLLANLPGKDVDLPAFPDVVRRLQMTHADPQFAAIVEDWQPKLGQSILNGWGLPGGDPSQLEPLPRLLSAAKLRHRLANEPCFRAAPPGAETVLAAVSFGSTNFIDLLPASQQDI